MSAPVFSIVIINGSVRAGNYTAMASALVADELRKDPGVSVEVVDPATLDLPLPGLRPDSPDTKRLRELVSHASGVVLATPEYHGSFSGAMKLIIENLGFPSALAGKPVSLLGVAAGAIGAIKSLEHLRGVCAHVGAIALPLPISVANVHKVFDRDGRCLDPAMEALVRRAGSNLTNYIHRHVCPAMQLEQLLRQGAAQR
ncbi:MAG: NAD(P)H-dependent oxidoreductase [Myxococcales bacterium]|nr:NAD(P)H-dependent oxidoreductase [Myxococcales bacterium]